MFTSHVMKTKSRNHSISKFKNLGYDRWLQYNNPAKNQVSAVFHWGAIRRSVSPKFIELWKETPCLCLSLHTASAREIWVDLSGFSRREKFWCPGVKLTSQERHWNQATFLTGDGIKYPRKGIYNFKSRASWQRVFLNYFGVKNGSWRSARR